MGTVQWVENTAAGPRVIGGRLLQPGEGIGIESGPFDSSAPTSPVARNSVLGDLPGVLSTRMVRLNVLMKGEGVRSAIQSALDGGYANVIVSGDANTLYELADPLKIDDYSRFTLDARLQWPAGYQYNSTQRAMLENRHSNSPRQNVNVTASGTVATIVSSDGSPLRLRDASALTITGSVVRGFNGVYEFELVNPTTARVVLPGRPESNIAIADAFIGSVQIQPANQYIFIEGTGTLDGNYLKNPVVDDRPTMGVILASIRKSSLKGLRIHNSQGYAVTVAGASAVRVTGLDIVNKNRDGIHVQGTCFNITVEDNDIESEDDAISATTGDYAFGNEVFPGEIEGLFIRKNRVKVPITGAGVAMFGKSRNWMSDVEIDGLRANCAGAAVHIKEYTSGLTNPYKLDQVVFRGTLTIKNVVFENLTGENNYASILLVTGDPILKKVYLDEVELDGDTAQFCRLFSFLRTNRDWSIEELRISKFRSYLQGTQPFNVGAAGITIGKLVIEDSAPWISDYGTAFKSSGMTIGQVLLTDVAADLGQGATLFALDSGTVGRVILTRCEPEAVRVANTGYLVYSNGASVESVAVIETAFSGAVAIWGDVGMNVAQGHRIRLSGLTLRSGAKACELNKGCKIMSDQQVELGAATAVYALAGAAQVYEIQEGAIDSARTAPFSFAGGATVNLFAARRRVAIDTVGINRVEGGQLFNTKAAATNGTDGACGTGLFTCISAAAGSWRRLGTAGGAGNQY